MRTRLSTRSLPVSIMAVVLLGGCAATAVSNDGGNAPRTSAHIEQAAPFPADVGPTATTAPRVGRPSSSSWEAANTATPTATSTTPAPLSPGRLKLVNYFPSAAAQGLFWSNWTPSVIDADFAVVSETLHADSVRVFVPTYQFGWPTASQDRSLQLAQLVRLAATHGLRVYLDLFNYFVPNNDIQGSKRWAASVLSPYVGDPRIVAVEVENEIDPSDPSAIAWARAMIPYVRQIAGGTPVAISVCGCDNTAPLQLLHAALGPDQPDVYDFHYYPGPDANPTPTQAQGVGQAAIQNVFAQAKSIVTLTTLIVGETGLSTYYPDTPDFPGATSDSGWERTQASYFAKVEAAAAAVDIPPAAPWGYIDVAYGGGVTNARQRFFGIFRSNGTAKPAAAVVASTFSSF